MRDKVESITPGHHPTSLFEEGPELVKDAKAAIIIWADKKGALHWRDCGMESRNVLWCLEKMKMSMLGDNS